MCRILYCLCIMFSLILAWSLSLNYNADGRYAYAGGYTHNSNYTSALISPSVQVASGLSSLCFTFWLFAHGSNSSRIVIHAGTDAETSKWSESKDLELPISHHNRWVEAQVITSDPGRFGSVCHRLVFNTRFPYLVVFCQCV